MKHTVKGAVLALVLCLPFPLHAQKYENGLIDKTIAVVGNEMISISDLEGEVQMMRAEGYASDRNVRCEILEQMMESKLFLMQARIDSLSINNDMVDGELSNRMDMVRTQLGGDEAVEKYFGKPLYKLRQEWRKALEDQSLTQQMQSNIMSDIPEITPYDVKCYVDSTSAEDLPMVPIKYQLSQICIYPDREAANMAVKERLLAIRERIINGEKFSTLARIYSQDPGSARRGGELGMASKSIFWPAFSDAAMALKPGVVSQIVETPDGFHIIEVLEKKCPRQSEDRACQRGSDLRSCGEILFGGSCHEDQRRTDVRSEHRLVIFRDRPAQAAGLCRDKGFKGGRDLRTVRISRQRGPFGQYRI